MIFKNGARKRNNGNDKHTAYVKGCGSDITNTLLESRNTP